MKNLFSILFALLLCSSVHAQDLSNDNKSRAKVIASLPFTQTVDISSSTKEDGEVFMEECGMGSGKTAWWKINITQNGFLKIHTRDSDFDTVLDIQNVDEILKCNDDSPAEDDETASALMQEVKRGQTYLIRVYAYNDEQESYSLSLNVELLTPSINTTLAAAQAINSYPVETEFIVGENANEATEAKPSCASTADNNSIWIKLNGVTAGMLIANTNGSEMDTNLSLWKGAKHPLTEVACNEDNGEGGVSRLSAEVNTNDTYYLRIAGFEGKTGLAKLNLKIADKVNNDNYATATDVRSFPFEDGLTIDGATTEEDEEHASCSTADAHSVWYKVTPTRNGTLTINTLESDFDTVVSLWRASGFKLNEQACNDDSQGVTSLVAAYVEANKTYFIRVTSVSEEAFGTLKLKVDFGASPPNDLLAEARVLDRLPFNADIEVGNASTQKDETALCASAPNTVWLKYTPEKDGLLSVEAYKNVDVPPVIAVLTGENHPLESKACTSQSASVLTDTSGEVEDFEPPVIIEEDAPVDAPAELEGEEGSDTMIEMGDAVTEVVSESYKQPYVVEGSDYAKINTFVQGGKTYYIAVATEGAVAGKVKLKIENQKIWKNASAERAQVISTATFPQEIKASITASAYSGDNVPSCGSSFFSPHWYKVEVPTSTILKLSTAGSDFDTIVGVWKSGAEMPLEAQVGCHDDISEEDKTSKLTTILTGGATYYILVGAYDINGGNLVLTLDKGEISKRATLSGAVNIDQVPYEEVVSEEEIGVMQPDETAPSCGTETSNPLWWKVDGSILGSVEFSTSGSTYDTVLSLWEGTSHPLTEVGCNDDGAEGNFSVLSTSLEEGKTYYVRVAGFNAAVGQTHLNVQTFIPPTNDKIEDAESIENIPFEGEGSLKGATMQADETVPTCAEGAQNAVWWKYTAARTESIQFKAEPTAFDVVMGVYTGSAHPLEEVACADKSGPAEAETIAFNAVAGTSYWIRVATFSGAGAEVKLMARALAPIANDNLNGATVVRMLPYTVETDNASATGQEGEALGDCGNEDTNSLWWKYTATSNKEITFSTSGSDFDTVVSVWTGTTHPLTQAACNDDSDEGLQAKTTLSVESGKTYYISVSGIRSATGNVKLSIE